MEDELDYRFGNFGPIRSVDLKQGFAFVEFDYEEDAEDAVRSLDGKEIDGSRVLVQFARGGRGPGGRPPAPFRGIPPQRSEHRAVFSHLPRDMSWQDLKDLCREYGAPVFTDVFRERGVSKGIAEFRTRDDLKRAVRNLDDKYVDGGRITVDEDIQEVLALLEREGKEIRVPHAHLPGVTDHQEPLLHVVDDLPLQEVALLEHDLQETVHHGDALHPQEVVLHPQEED
eukprot:CAMPEP_0201475456 /NCGR_PEP_ID=MMETSP0151_2-20130828/884_1 /ASSEMBLY_ACC=CAM_ASM_000257 /TAXON_ID=200890 /ORGANISM="Paramoeba atlantica, Strain 621/1 / CCAP 1560/9" /LENGTH=227 /DNA_ID=CAMNT_0047855557 /DNA_START=103 /DNA_END=784 /DNA_ORIENTATION=+